jgi:hypothetical protein
VTEVGSERVGELVKWKAGALFAGNLGDAAWATLGVDVTGLDLQEEAS